MLRSGIIGLFAIVSLSGGLAHASPAALPPVIPPGGIDWPDNPGPADYACTIPQEDIKTRVYQALRFLKQGSDEKALRTLELLFNDL
jgi:hypothetical protein